MSFLNIRGFYFHDFYTAGSVRSCHRSGIPPRFTSGAWIKCPNLGLPLSNKICEEGRIIPGARGKWPPLRTLHPLSKSSQASVGVTIFCNDLSFRLQRPFDFCNSSLSFSYRNTSLSFCLMITKIRTMQMTWLPCNEPCVFWEKNMYTICLEIEDRHQKLELF